jgi:hypothetical protein
MVYLLSLPCGLPSRPWVLRYFPGERSQIVKIILWIGGILLLAVGLI